MFEKTLDLLAVPARPEPGQRVVAIARDAFASSPHRALVLCESEAPARYREYGVATWDETFGLVWIECHIAELREAKHRFALYNTETEK